MNPVFFNFYESANPENIYFLNKRNTVLEAPISLSIFTGNRFTPMDICKATWSQIMPLTSKVLE